MIGKKTHYECPTCGVKLLTTDNNISNHQYSADCFKREMENKARAACAAPVGLVPIYKPNFVEWRPLVKQLREKGHNVETFAFYGPSMAAGNETVQFLWYLPVWLHPILEASMPTHRKVEIVEAVYFSGRTAAEVREYERVAEIEANLCGLEITGDPTGKDRSQGAYRARISDSEAARNYALAHYEQCLVAKKKP